MGNFRDRMARFMYGRYGIDQLYYALFVFYFILVIVNLVFQSPILGVLNWAVLLYMAYRLFSRNIARRRAENDRFLKIWNPVKSSCLLTFRRVKEIRTHRFRKCPHCKASLRLPRKSGKHAVVCPRCRREFEVRIL